MASEQEIIDEIDTYMRKVGGLAKDWYVGIATDPEARLFSDHNVDKANDAWIYLPASSASAARRIEKAYLDTGHDGGPGGGSATTRYVYAYRKTGRTVQ